MIRVAGIDGYRKGWVAVVLDDGCFAGAGVARSLEDLISDLDVAVIGVDIPIGLPETGFREAARLARTFVGPRWGSVFLTPPLPVWQASTIEEARALSVTLTQQSIPSQTYMLRPRVLEADGLVRSDSRIHEVHPEVSFRELAGRPLLHAKSTWAGVALRRSLLAAAGIEIPEALGAAGIAGVDDVFDAAVVAWSADRIARDVAQSLPPTSGDAPRHGAIWY